MISVIMPTYSEPLRYIKQAINSILNQSYKDIELIVILDKPERNDILRYISKTHDKRIITIVNEHNIGITASLNKGIASARGEYIARMDADDISLPDRLQKQLKYLETNGYDLVGCDIANIDTSGYITKERVVFPRDNKSIKKYMRYNSPIPHPTWLGKRVVFKNNQYIDFPACEDYDFLVRSALNGKKLGNLGEVLLKYRQNTSGISYSKKAIQKTGLAYIRKKYKKGECSDYNEYMDYLKSAKGIKRQNETARYYELKRMIARKKGIPRNLYIIKSIPQVMNLTACGITYNTIRTKLKRKEIEKKESL